ncbi:hypothetical protein SEMRO_2637_G333340.1 [Seminavis robusta]|uniref:Uncharacterized protein n=1 Tax=Seminavis robusta TaxID=568900 RepID=A0A9N8HYT7_9STRA|nr:hypothetical protein SEMRO_2637_G333340.1 [Seminavis robusta]|eukprot:Sro2637_g333340.1 n/a (135) ;mRNA; f:10006-10410
MASVVSDTRKVVGGECWALAKQVTHDAKRLFGSACGETWLKGTVQQVELRKKTPDAKRGTNYIRALYKLGPTKAVEQWICLQSLKATNPNPSVDPIGAATAEQQQVQNNSNPPPAEPTTNNTDTSPQALPMELK